LDAQKNYEKLHMRYPIPKALKAMVVFAALLLPALAHAVDFPNGTNTIGTVTNVGTFGGGFTRFEVRGPSVNYAFWISPGTPSSATQFASVLAAASQGRQVNIWHYGEVLNYGGQSGYLVSIVFVDF
jgi:hypothetical protein